ncbi:hypothetical protein A4X09_0g6517 [Tilletia walkeri]|uniref:Uncharacterized protein n=1 Tax=Tilletia walkeri TaxID=117179 RepID=A0A8X7N3N5_9BASI|nr:hypothetical protein A4X09_0g6517 [Tilletia walkeri]
MAAGRKYTKSWPIIDTGAKIFLADFILQDLSSASTPNVWSHLATPPNIYSTEGSLHGRIQKPFQGLYFASIWFITRSV